MAGGTSGFGKKTFLVSMLQNIDFLRADDKA
jgi:hypothetical protein